MGRSYSVYMLVIVTAFICCNDIDNVTNSYLLEKESIKHYLKEEREIEFDEHCGFINEIPVLMQDYKMKVNIYILCNYSTNRNSLKDFEIVRIVNSDIFFKNKKLTFNEFKVFFFVKENEQKIIFDIPKLSKNIEAQRYLFELYEFDNDYSINIAFTNKKYALDYKKRKPRIIVD
jgi:hypothetical protein